MLRATHKALLHSAIQNWGLVLVQTRNTKIPGCLYQHVGIHNPTQTQCKTIQDNANLLAQNKRQKGNGGIHFCDGNVKVVFMLGMLISTLLLCTLCTIKRKVSLLSFL